MATKLTSADISEIVRQSDVTSLPHRNNNTAFKDKINELIDEIDALSSSTSTSEIISARDNFSTLQDRIHSGESAIGNGVLSVNRVIIDCESVTDLPTNSADATAPVLNSTDFVEGSNSLSLGKSGTSSTSASYDTASVSYNFDGYYLEANVYIDNNIDLAKISEFNIYLTPDANFSTNYKLFDVASSLQAKWNKLKIEVDAPDSTTGTVENNDIIQFIRFEIVTNNAADTIASGNVAIDFVNYYGNELAVREQATPNMTVQIYQGNGIINGVGCTKTATSNSGTITAPSANPRWDIVTLNVNNDLTVITGSENASPVVPKTPFNHIVLARIYHRVGSTSILNVDDSTNSFIVDLRTFVSRNFNVFTNNNEIVLGVTNIYEDVTLDANGLLSSIDYKIGGSSGTTIASSSYTYSGNVQTQRVLVYGAVTYTTDYTYNTNNELTNYVVTIS